MKKGLIYLLLVILCATMTACTSTFGMEEQNIDSSTVSLNIGDYVLLGKYYDKPILWRCVDIDENGMLMLSEKLLCRRPFDMNNGYNTGSHARRVTRNLYRYNTSNYWGDSNIRSWLGSAAPTGEVKWLCGNSRMPKEEKGFLADGNFTHSERDVIKEVTQKSLLDPADAELAVEGKGSWGFRNISFYRDSGIQEFVENRYDEVYYEYVTDRMFLLDIKQLWNITQNQHILGEDFFIATFTQEAIDNDKEEQERISQNLAPYLSTEEPYYYLLRTPYGWGLITGMDCVYDSGDLVMCTKRNPNYEYGINNVSETLAYSTSGIRPAFYLDETSAQILSGSGTEADPYVIDGKKNDNIHVYCDGWELKFDVQPVNENGRVLVPMRKIFETLGASIDWNESTCTVTAVKDETTVSLQIDQREMYVNGEMIWLDVPPKIVDNRTLIPLRAISEALGANVEWIEESRRVNITT